MLPSVWTDVCCSTLQQLDLSFNVSLTEQAEAAADPPSSTHLSSGTARPLILDRPLAEEKQAAIAVVDTTVTASKPNATAVATQPPVTAEGLQNVITEEGSSEPDVHRESGGEISRAAAPAADDDVEVSYNSVAWFCLLLLLLLLQMLPSPVHAVCRQTSLITMARGCIVAGAATRLYSFSDIVALDFVAKATVLQWDCWKARDSR